MPAWLINSAAWFDSDYAAFFVLVAVTALCAVVESAVPAFGAPARRLDRWPANVALWLANISVAAILPVSALAAAETARGMGFGLLNVLAPAGWVAALFTFAVISFAFYFQHLISHKTPTLWRIHRVHHLDTHLDVSTSGRHHPFEPFVGLLVSVPLIFLFGLSPESLLIYFVAAPLMSALAHANVRLPTNVDRIVRLLFVTPNMHSLHHSASQIETDSNYGDVFTIWDRLFGTYKEVSDDRYRKMVIGLHEVQDGRADDFWWQLRSPFLRRLEAPDHGSSNARHESQQRSAGRGRFGPVL